jgi:hypothetical protein
MTTDQRQWGHPNALHHLQTLREATARRHRMRDVCRPAFPADLCRVRAGWSVMNRNGYSSWIDPAPLEVSRPRLPWWTMLPGWVKAVLSPIALVWLLCWIGLPGRPTRLPIPAHSRGTAGRVGGSEARASGSRVRRARRGRVTGGLVVATPTLLPSHRGSASAHGVPPFLGLRLPVAHRDSPLGADERQARQGIPPETRPGPLGRLA